MRGIRRSIVGVLVSCANTMPVGGLGWPHVKPSTMFPPLSYERVQSPDATQSVSVV